MGSKYILDYGRYINERYETDEKYSILCREFYNMVTDKLEDGTGLIASDTGSFILLAEEIDSEYSDLILVFTYPNDPMLSKLNIENASVQYAFGKSGDKYVIVCNNLLNPFDKTYIDTRLRLDLLSHEFIHYLDSKRGKYDVHKSDYGTILGYYNDSHEYNAYFMEGASKVINIFKNKDTVKQILKTTHINSFWDFKNFTKKLFDENWYNHLNDKYMKKFNKRLYSIYVNLF